MSNLDRFDGPPYQRDPPPRRMTALEQYMVLGYDPADDMEDAYAAADKDSLEETDQS